MNEIAAIGVCIFLIVFFMSMFIWIEPFAAKQSVVAKREKRIRAPEPAIPLQKRNDSNLLNLKKGNDSNFSKEKGNDSNVIKEKGNDLNLNDKNIFPEPMIGLMLYEPSPFNGILN